MCDESCQGWSTSEQNLLAIGFIGARGLKLTIGGLGLGSVEASSYAQGISSGTFAKDIGEAQ